MVKYGFHYTPPKTCMFPNKHAGEACPTRITWFGSPLPQFGVPYIPKVSELPTPFKLFQNGIEMENPSGKWNDLPKEQKLCAIYQKANPPGTNTKSFSCPDNKINMSGICCLPGNINANGICCPIGDTNINGECNIPIQSYSLAYGNVDCLGNDLDNGNYVFYVTEYSKDPNNIVTRGFSSDDDVRFIGIDDENFNDVELKVVSYIQNASLSSKNLFILGIA